MSKRRLALLTGLALVVLAAAGAYAAIPDGDGGRVPRLRQDDVRRR
jgi:hypothetical protein